MVRFLAYKVAETDDFLAFLDVNPNSTKGHTLCASLKRKSDKLFDLEEETYIKLMTFSRRQVAISFRKS